jgi:ferredoxin
VSSLLVEEKARESNTVAEQRHRILAASRLQVLVEALSQKGHEVIAPTLREGAIVYDRVKSAEELPIGSTDEQKPGHYRVKRSADVLLFGCAVGPHSVKTYLHPAEVQLWPAERQDGLFRILNSETQSQPQYAFLGVRPCDLSAIGVQDKVLMGGKYRDPIYAKHRKGLFIVVVQCTRAVETCFCVSMGTGPRACDGFDLALTELDGASGHRFVVEAGSGRGAEVLADLETTPASEDDLREAEASVEAARRQQVRSIETEGIQDLLYQNFEHPRWDDVANRCLACGNCTMVCPTCFCTTVEDMTDASGDHAERWQRWDSCFTLSFSYIHGGHVRASGKSRYRQWMTHKLASWIDQFGTSGCVGCGRCITWCPVGIDITEEVRMIRERNSHGNT